MRIAAFLLALGTSASLLPAVAHAQPPAQLSPPAEPATGSISGRLVFEGPQPDFDEGPPIPFMVFVIPAHKPQPINLLENLNLQNIVIADMNGTFFAGGLADGDYFLFPINTLVSSIPSPESISVVGFAGDEPSMRLAVRLTVANGQAITGVEMVVILPEPIPTPTPGAPVQLSPPSQLSPPGGLSVVSVLVGPTTGAGPGGADVAVDRIAVGLAVAAALLLAGGVALRARGRRLL